MDRKAQMSTEFLFLVGFVMLILAGTLAYSFRQSSSAAAINEANDAVSSAAAAADYVYAMGPGSEKRIAVTIPGGAFNSAVTPRHINLFVHIFGGDSEFHAISAANLTGSFPSSRGTYEVSAKALDSGVVEISFNQ